MKTHKQKEINLRAAESALSSMAANDRKIWADCGMGMKQEFGQEGFDIWDRWSKRSPKYSVEDTKAQWASFKNSKSKKPIGIATIFYHAQRIGNYINDGSYKPISLTPEQKKARTNEIEELLVKDKALRAAAARKAKEIWESTSADDNLNSHSYIIKKKIKAYGAKYYEGDLSIAGMKCNGALMLPMMKNGEVTSLQFISSSGDKKLLPNGTKGSMVIEELNSLSSDKPICICEGYATGASIHEATSYPVVVAFDAGSLVRTAKEIRAKYPNRKIIVCADNDESGVGLKFANSAAAAIAGFVALPESITHQNVISPFKDFNDFAKDDGFDEVKLSIDSAKPAEITNEDATAEFTSPSSMVTDEYVSKVKLTCAANIKPEAINWIWNGWLAGGKFHILGGQAGTGKTTIAINLAAIISKGGQFPDGTIAHQGNVLIWSGEDGVKDTIVPRLMSAGADLSKVHVIEGYQYGSEMRSFDPATDLISLEEQAEEMDGISLIIVDPVVSVVKGDSHKNAEVRNSLKPLVDLGEKLGCAILGITHFTKGTSGGNTLERITGSLAFGAVARVVMAAGKRIEKDEDGEEIDAQWFFCRAKSNLGQDSGGFQYELIQKETGVTGIIASTVNWLETVDGNARDLLSDYFKKKDGKGKASELETAINFLGELLAEKQVPSNIGELEAKNAGFSKATIRRAKERLGVKSRKSTMDGGWCWFLPKQKSEDAQNNEQDAQPFDMNTFEEMNTFGKNKTSQLTSGHGVQ